MGVILGSLIAALVLRLWFLQVLNHHSYSQAAENNQVRLVPSEAARGHILDRNGEILVSNRASLVVSIRRDEIAAGQEEPTLQRLSATLGVPVDKLKERLADQTLLPYAPIPVAEDVQEDTMVYIREHQEEFPGVITESRPVRTYPLGRRASHVLGYVGEINADQLKDDRYKIYRPGSIIGRSGIEDAYEAQLHGREGLLKLEVDRNGKVRRRLGERNPQPGQDLVTTLDAKLQAVVEDSLVQGIQKAREVYDKASGKKYLASAGGAVVLDPRNGEILALASFPDYDPNAFVGGISQAEFDLLAKDPANPLLDRVTQSAFPPGSTFKVVTAAAALQDGVATASQKFACPASVRYANTTFRNWKTSDSGALSLTQAIADSCDTVFYPWGYEFYRRFRNMDGHPERLQEYARAFGFGKKTGVEIPFEKAGRVPDEAWLREIHARLPKAFPYAIWLPGYTVNMSIGQGDVLATPLQLANAYAAIANGGTLYKPHIGLKLEKGSKTTHVYQPEKLGTIPVSQANLAAIQVGLEAVTTSGTAAGTFAGFPLQTVPVAAKTGTAELQTKPPQQPYAWFVAYAPSNNPQYVVAVMLEEGGHGGETAAPIARRILEGIFNLPLSEIAPAARTD
jgi:penicillin-binding protein 2